MTRPILTAIALAVLSAPAALAQGAGTSGPAPVVIPTPQPAEDGKPAVIPAGKSGCGMGRRVMS